MEQPPDKPKIVVVMLGSGLNSGGKKTGGACWFVRILKKPFT
jgi:hypothetical protein